MRKFEYDTLQIDTKGFWGSKIDTDNIKQKLNEMGQNGWELVGMTSASKSIGETSWIICTFKREIVN